MTFNELMSWALDKFDRAEIIEGSDGEIMVCTRVRIKETNDLGQEELEDMEPPGELLMGFDEMTRVVTGEEIEIDKVIGPEDRENLPNGDELDAVFDSIFPREEE